MCAPQSLFARAGARTIKEVHQVSPMQKRLGYGKLMNH